MEHRNFGDVWSPKICENCCFSEVHVMQPLYWQQHTTHVKCLSFNGQDYIWALGKSLLLKDEPLTSKSGTIERSSPTKFTQQWRDGDRLLTLMERSAEVEPVANQSPIVCPCCDFTEDFKNLWKPEKAGIIKMDWFGGERWAWFLGSFLVLKERHREPLGGSEESVIYYVGEHTTIPVPSFVKIWNEDGWVLNLQERMPGVTLEQAKANFLSKNTLTPAEVTEAIEEANGYVMQLRDLQSPHMGRPDGQPIKDIPMNRELSWAAWPLLPNEEDYKREFYQRALTGVSKSDLSELDSIYESFPTCKPFTMTHVDLHPSNIMVVGKRISGIIDWDMCGFAPVWWQRGAADQRDARFDKSADEGWAWMHRLLVIYEPNHSRSLPWRLPWKKSHPEEDTIVPGPFPYPTGRCVGTKVGPIFVDADGNEYRLAKSPNITDIPDFDITKFGIDKFRAMVERRSRAGQSKEEKKTIENLIRTREDFEKTGKRRW